MYTEVAPAIREDYSTGLFTKTSLAEKYNCHPQTITNILKSSEKDYIYQRTATLTIF